jgi:hypothetical protein
MQRGSLNMRKNTIRSVLCSRFASVFIIALENFINKEILIKSLPRRQHHRIIASGRRKTESNPAFPSFNFLSDSYWPWNSRYKPDWVLKIIQIKPTFIIGETIGECLPLKFGWVPMCVSLSGNAESTWNSPWTTQVPLWKFDGLYCGEDSVFLTVFSRNYKLRFEEALWFRLHFQNLSAGQVWVRHRAPFSPQWNHEFIVAHSGRVSRRLHMFPWFEIWFSPWMRLWARGNVWPNGFPDR